MKHIRHLNDDPKFEFVSDLGEIGHYEISVPSGALRYKATKSGLSLPGPNRGPFPKSRAKVINNKTENTPIDGRDTL